MKKEIKNLLKLARKIVKKETYVKLTKIEEGPDLVDALKYSITIALENEEERFKKKIAELKKEGRNVFFAESKAILLPSKIKHFTVSFDEREFYKLENLFSKVKKEIENV